MRKKYKVILTTTIFYFLCIGQSFSHDLSELFRVMSKPGSEEYKQMQEALGAIQTHKLEDISLDWEEICVYRGVSINWFNKPEDFSYEKDNLLLVNIDNDVSSKFDLKGCKLKEGKMKLPSSKKSGNNIIKYPQYPSSFVSWNVDYIGNSGDYVKWHFPFGQGQHDIEKNYRLGLVAADPSGKYIAVSIDGKYRTSSKISAIYLIRTSDGQKVFSRYFDNYDDPKIAFGSGYFAYSYIDRGGLSYRKSSGEGLLRVFKIPD
ncbi:MAG: hypothetical protein PQ612_07025 [Rickettsiales bacterium]|nr:hypothetical protein [Pseudomonadota bacterium]MDG4543756.1 hypothetical protein [Rickettsiales bacterium]MDG4545903.1 hypothetical protein [Rickettsiales bacterium]MDG4548149.1 hypothetical protein [Rickettsiales bacterium]